MPLGVVEPPYVVMARKSADNASFHAAPGGEFYASEDS